MLVAIFIVSLLSMFGIFGVYGVLNEIRICIKNGIIINNVHSIVTDETNKDA